MVPPYRRLVEKISFSSQFFTTALPPFYCWTTPGIKHFSTRLMPEVTDRPKATFHDSSFIFISKSYCFSATYSCFLLYFTFFDIAVENSWKWKRSTISPATTNAKHDRIVDNAEEVLSSEHARFREQLRLGFKTPPQHPTNS